MSRYSIALKKTQREIEREHLVTGFGFEQDKINVRRQSLFIRMEETSRVGIVYDDPYSLFYCAKVHFFKSHRFFCKSTPGHLAYCCQPEYAGRQPGIRIATIVVQYSLPYDSIGLDNIKVVPWIFGKPMFNKLKQSNNVFPVDKHDFVLKCSDDRAFRFKQYDLTGGLDSLWQKSEMKPRILEIHSYLKKTIRSYLAEDYSDNDILNAISQPDRGDLISRRPATQVDWQPVNGGSGPRPVSPEGTNEEDDFFRQFFAR